MNIIFTAYAVTMAAAILLLSIIRYNTNNTKP
jgi:hypothetical protein